MRKIFVLSIILTLSFAMYSCVPKQTKPKLFICPEPQQNCQQTKWAGAPYDTSADAVKNLDSYFVFEQVKQINTPGDEWALSFISPRQAILTYTDANQQRAMKVKMIEYNKGTLESGIGIPMEGSSGPFSFHDKELVFSEVLTDAMTGNSDLYTANINGNLLSDVKLMDKNINVSPVSWESQPSFSPDGKIIIFASDLWNATKGTDIFFTVKQTDGTWSDPINCGENVNSSCDELTPFVSKDGRKLFFSSLGHESVGGYDIFVSEISDAFWNDVKANNFADLKKSNHYFTKALNLGQPLNTPYDELFPSTPVDDDSLLYYSSNQNSGSQSSIVMMQGGFDMFVRRRVTRIKVPVEKPKDVVINKVPIVETKIPEQKPIPQNFVLEGTVYNAKSKEVIPNANITVKEVPPAETPKEITSDDKGKYKVQLNKNREYEVIAQARDLFFDSFTLRVEPTDTATFIKRDINIPEMFTLRVNFPTNEWKSPYKYVLDSNGVETNVEWQREIDLISENIIKSKDYIEKIQFVGHTDDVASVEYNQKLGQKRVDFVISQLVKRGVPEKLLEGRSAGKLEPLHTREGEDLSMFRKRLRRVEMIKVLKVN